jgi:hypothetical protein
MIPEASLTTAAGRKTQNDFISWFYCPHRPTYGFDDSGAFMAQDSG